ncbi:putative ribonuclease H protein [Glycine max]|nr:putative ribonuclease H protein [Glycine max]
MEMKINDHDFIYLENTWVPDEQKMENVKAIKAILWSFELVSGLKINFSKSSFGVVGMLERWKEDAAMFLNCSLLVIPFLYLGTLIGTNPRRTEVWDPIIKKCERKLSKWKQKLLSFGGRVTLMKSILNSIPIYLFSFFRVPNKILDKLVRIQQRFLWGGGLEQRKIA